MKIVRRLGVHHIIGCLIASVALLGLSGCGSSPPSAQPQAVSQDDHAHVHSDDDGHVHSDDGHNDASPADFTAGVATLRGHYQAIRDAFAEGDLDKAHDPLHEVGNVLEGLPELATKAGLTEKDLTTAQAAVTAMFEAYGQIDQAIHDGEKADYEAVREKLDKGMADLDAVLQGMKKES